MITEEEAKTRWCPFARVTSDVAGDSSWNRFADEAPPGAHCIGSSCMAWRSVDQPRHWAVTKDGQTQTIDYDPNYDMNFATSEYYGAITIDEIQPKIVGFCGLAGKP